MDPKPLVSISEDLLKNILQNYYCNCNQKGLQPVLLNKFPNGLNFAKATEALILYPPHNPFAFLKIAQNHEGLEALQNQNELSHTLVPIFPSTGVPSQFHPKRSNPGPHPYNGYRPDTYID